MLRPITHALVLGAAASAATIAHAHITLEGKEAAAASTYKAVLRVGHGCEGAPTEVIRVQIPEGVIAVKPMPKPGWDLETVVDKYDQPYQYYEATLTEGVKEIRWSGNSLPDAWYEEFVFRGRLPDQPAGTVIYFPVVQECAEGVHRWIEIPAEGKTVDDYEEPAPGVTLSPKVED